MSRSVKKGMAAFMSLLVCGLLVLLCGCSQQSQPERVELPQPVEGTVQLKNDTGKTVTGLEYRTMEETEYTAIQLEDGSWLSGNWIRFEKLEEYQEQPFALRLTFEDGTTLEVSDLLLFGNEFLSIDGEGNVTTYLYQDQMNSSETSSTSDTLFAA